MGGAASLCDQSLGVIKLVRENLFWYPSPPPQTRIKKQNTNAAPIMDRVRRR